VNNSRYTIALHILTYLAMEFEGRNTSEDMGKSINTNPVVVRRILSTLREAGYVRSQPGVGGGITLIKPSISITLLDVYQLFEADELFPMHSKPPAKKCPSGATIQPILKPIYDEAHQAMCNVLSQTTIAQLAERSWSAYRGRITP
jgi:Rrf2 family protein